MAHTLPDLPYAHDALEPHIDARTMEIHHGKHHQGYVNNLNAALEGHADLQARSVEDLLRGINDVPEAIRGAVRNNGGGHANHTLFWSVLAAPDAVPFAPRSPLGRAIRREWFHLEGFWEALRRTGLGVFGSGWVWLCTRPDGSLFLSTTANQDNPLMPEHGGEVAFPVLGVDVWEHAYYLRYQNARGDYLSALQQCVNWEEANRRYEVRSIRESV